MATIPDISKQARQIAIDRLKDLGLIDFSTTQDEVDLRLLHAYDKLTGIGTYSWNNGCTSYTCICYNRRTQDIYKYEQEKEKSQ